MWAWEVDDRLSGTEGIERWRVSIEGRKGLWTVVPARQ